MKKFLIGVPMYFFGANALLGYVTLMLLFLGILIGLLFNSIAEFAILQNIIFLYDDLLRNGVVGWIVAIWIPGQFFLSYAIYNFLKEYYY